MEPTTQEIVAVIVLSIFAVFGMILFFRAAKAEQMERRSSEFHLHGGF